MGKAGSPFWVICAFVGPMMSIGIVRDYDKPKRKDVLHDLREVFKFSIEDDDKIVTTVLGPYKEFSGANGVVNCSILDVILSNDDGEIGSGFGRQDTLPKR
jgi:hypothetical protein